jgi:metal-responsive CopG/Arc/MetJ family transcriptional regulator
MEQSGYKNRFEIKNQRLYLRLDASMIDKLKEIRRKTGISVSEIVREAVRRLLQDVGETGNVNLNLD